MQSSYLKNNIGKTIYNFVNFYKPTTIYEFGVLDGYSTEHILKAIQNGWGRNNGSRLFAYDLWDDYEYKHSERNEVEKRLHSKDKFCQLYTGKEDFYNWITNPPKSIDMLHLDISNDGDIIELAIDNLPEGTLLLFEGGSEERDHVDWMLRYKRKPITSIKYNYTILNKNFPSISFIEVPCKN